MDDERMNGTCSIAQLRSNALFSWVSIVRNVHMLKKTQSAVLLFATVALLAMAARTAAQTTVISPESERRAESLLKQMTIDEKIGQMNQAAGVVMPMLGSQKPDDLITQGKVGSVLWLIDVKEINRL